MCTITTRLHRTYRHPTLGTVGPSEWLSKCAWAWRQASGDLCPDAVRYRTTAIALDSVAAEYCDRCLIFGANVARKKGMDPDAYVKAFGVSLARSWLLRRRGGSGAIWMGR